MQIGEFAKICQTKITVLRHYDKEGLLTPDYVDSFTGYRYYSKEQIAVFKQITALKKAGFSLQEIRQLLQHNTNNQQILDLFNQKKKDLLETLTHLEEAKNIILGEQNMHVTFIENKKAHCFIEDVTQVSKAIETIKNELHHYGYQRTSSFQTTKSDDGYVVSTNVIALNKEAFTLHETFTTPFENDKEVIGKWEICGEYDLKEDFFPDSPSNIPSHPIYFLENGERFWSYSWTKGKLMIDDDTNQTINDYTLETINGILYMFVSLKSYAYLHGGNTTTLVLKQIDQVHYKAEDLVKKDNINIPFENDPNLLGHWTSVAFCKHKEAFDPHQIEAMPLYLAALTFLENGEMISYYDYGKEKIEGKDKQEWTKGYWLRKWNQCACGYELKEIEGITYLMMEWKSGNYRYGGFETDYYIFRKAEN